MHFHNGQHWRIVYMLFGYDRIVIRTKREASLIAITNFPRIFELHL